MRALVSSLTTFGFVVLAIACSDESATNPQGCTPGEQQECACPGGEVSGVQVCSGDGRSFGECDCGGIPDTCGNGAVEAGEDCDDENSVNDDACSNACKNASCGDGIVQEGELCDDAGGSGEFDTCPDDCGVTGEGGAGGGGMGGAGGAGGGAATCDDVVVFAGPVLTQSSVWTSNGLTGLDAGNDLCSTMVALGTHVCTYAELKIADAKADNLEPNLGLLATTSTLWVHRDTPEMVDAVLSVPGAGSRCNDWVYPTNHISDGEYAVITAPSVLEYHLDGDTFFDGVDTTHTIPGDLDCGGMVRAIPCCNLCEP